jgi:hypothetical protein
LVYSARLHDVSRQIRLGIIDWETSSIEKNKLRLSLAEYLQELEKILIEEKKSDAGEKEKAKEFVKKLKKDAILSNQYMYFNPWQFSMNEVEQEFKNMLRVIPHKSYKLLESREHQEVIELWKSIEQNPYFDITHEYWRDKPFFRKEIQKGLIDLFISHVALSFKLNKSNILNGIKYLEKLLKVTPYAQDGPADDKLSPADAKFENQQLLAAFEYCNGYFLGMGSMLLSKKTGLGEHIFLNLEDEVNQKIRQIKLVMN